ncbi:MAG: NAD(+) synthase, partial [Thermofilaceae archaeon]
MNAQSREKSLSTPLEGDRDRGSGWRRFYERITSIDYASVERRISGYLREYLEEAGAGCYVLGLSGGIDSSVVTTLAARAVGPERVVALIMPDSTSTPGEDLEDARWLVRHLNIRFHEAPIDTLVAAASTSVPLFDQTDLKALGNLKARIRMLMLYYVANRLGGIVLGSGDRSELLLGYFTKYGDGAADLLP